MEVKHRELSPDSQPVLIKSTPDILWLISVPLRALWWIILSGLRLQWPAKQNITCQSEQMQAKKVIFTCGTLEEFKAPEHIKRARGDESGVRGDAPLTLMRWI